MSHNPRAPAQSCVEEITVKLDIPNEEPTNPVANTGAPRSRVTPQEGFVLQSLFKGYLRRLRLEMLDQVPDAENGNGRDPPNMCLPNPAHNSSLPPTMSSECGNERDTPYIRFPDPSTYPSMYPTAANENGNKMNMVDTYFPQPFGYPELADEHGKEMDIPDPHFHDPSKYPSLRRAVANEHGNQRDMPDIYYHDSAKDSPLFPTMFDEHGNRKCSRDIMTKSLNKANENYLKDWEAENEPLLNESKMECDGDKQGEMDWEGYCCWMQKR